MIQPKPRLVTFAVYGIPSIIAFCFAWIYISMQMHSIYGGDAGDVTLASYVWGIPHPPGYPLYTFLSGLFIHALSWGTVAWRACFLSSLPSALALYFLWRLCYRCTTSFFASTVAAVLFGFTSPVWLNAISQEVFGLYSFMSIVLLDQLVAWFEEGKQTQLLFLAFWTGIALTHHHAILFTILPAIMFIFWRRRDVLPHLVHAWWKIFLFGLLGFLPYIYAPIVSFRGTLFDIEHAATREGFIRLVTRASYGTFQATAGGPPMFLNRILNVYTFFQFIVRDFSLVGVVFILLGLFVLRKRAAHLYDFITVSLCSWILFFFIAGFTQLLNYQIGTTERFFIVPYQLLAVCVAYGIAMVLKTKKRIYMLVVFLLFVLLGFSQWKHNYQAFSLLRTDTSMEQLATDIAKSTPQNGILFLFEDTSTYAMYYTYFIQKKRPDIRFVFFRWFGNIHYRSFLRLQYPDLIVPEPKNSDYRLLIESFVTANIATHPLVCDTESNLLPGQWTAHGLLFLYSPDSTVSLDHKKIVQDTLPLWEQFVPPTVLIPFHKQIPMISDVLRVYGQHRSIVVREMALADLSLSDIENELQKALALELNVVPESYLYPIVILYQHNRCGDAKILLSLFVKKWGYDRAILRQYYKWKQVCGSDTDVDPFAAFYEKKFPKDIQNDQQ